MEWQTELKHLGQQLDQGCVLEVIDGGIVTPGVTSNLNHSGEESTHVSRQTKRGSAAGSRQGAEGWQRPTGWSTSPRPPLIITDFQANYEAELNDISTAYPGTKVWQKQDGMWLRTESALLQGASRNAVFITGIPYSDAFTLRSWAFWGGFEWIGPRHTNFPDGSSCAFEPSDRTWQLGESLVPLLDLLTVWALRHLHNLVFDRWPGRQAVRHPYERIDEIRDDEYCGCDGYPPKPYAQCCRDCDLKRNRIADAVNFTLHTGGVRRPPEAIIRFLCRQNDVPQLADLLSA